MRAKPGRPRAAHPKDRLISVRLPESGIKALDAARGGLSRSEFMRRLLRAHLEKGRTE